MIRFDINVEVDMGGAIQSRCVSAWCASYLETDVPMDVASAYLGALGARGKCKSGVGLARGNLPSIGTWRIPRHTQRIVKPR